MKNRFARRLFIVSIALLLVFSVLGASAAKVSDSQLNSWLRKAKLDKYTPAKTDYDALYAAAKLEKKVVVYSVSSRIPEVKKTFEAQYPGVTVETYDMASADIVTKIMKEQDAGIFNMDVVLNEDPSLMIGNLLANKYIWNFVPSDLATKVPKNLANPLLTCYVTARVVLYNTEVNQSCPIKSWWDLTTEKYKGKVLLKDPMLSAANMMFLVAITQHADAFAKDYEKVFGKKIALTTPNAGYEFIKALVKNGLVLTKSDGDISKAVGTKGQTDPPIGMTAFDKMREVGQKGYKMAYAKGISPIEGMNSPTYLGIGTLSPHPNAAKLFIRWIMGDEKGGQGAVPFYEPGCIMGRADVPPPAGTPTLAERNMWNPDVNAILKDYQKVTDFWLSLQ
ncbi:MAG: ABC transporter substrate-binding protein [Bacteroidota bacterium]